MQWNVVDDDDDIDDDDDDDKRDRGRDNQIYIILYYLLLLLRYQIMMNCWQSEPELRPSFAVLKQQLKRMENHHKVRF